MDIQNKQNLRMLLAYVVIFLTCIAVVAIMSVVFGSKLYNPVTNFYDRPVSTFEYKEHRI